MKKYIFIIFCIFSSYSFATNCLVSALSSFSIMGDAFRTPDSKLFWDLYKNDPRFETYLKSRPEYVRINNRYLNTSSKFEIKPPPKNKPKDIPTANHDDKTLDIVENTKTVDMTGTLDNSGDANTFDVLHSGKDLDQINNEMFQIARDYQRLSDDSKDAFKATAPTRHELDLTFVGTKHSDSGKFIKSCNPLAGNCPRPLMKYEEAVNQIKIGDEVVFPSSGNIPEKKFTVGKYLGAGNSTHVYEAVSETGEITVLRVPHVADFIPNRPLAIMGNRFIAPDGTFVDSSTKSFQSLISNDFKINRRIQSIHDKDYAAFRFSRQYVERQAKSACDPTAAKILNTPCYYQIKILSHDPNYRWVEVEKIEIADSGDSFMKKNSRIIREIKNGSVDQDLLKLFPNQSPDSILQIRHQLSRLEEVKSLALESKASDFHGGQVNWALRPDTGQWDWILTDW